MSRLELEGMIQRLRMERFNLATSADVKMRAIKQLLSMSMVTPIEETDIEGVHAMADELLEIKRQMVENLDKAKKIERELNG